LETQEALVPLLEDIKHIVEKTTGWKRPGDPRGLLRQRKPNTYRFKDDGLIPNHPRWPFIIYKSAVRLPQTLDPAAVFCLRRRIHDTARRQFQDADLSRPARVVNAVRRMAMLASVNAWSGISGGIDREALRSLRRPRGTRT
jgi:hypothetical protein